MPMLVKRTLNRLLRLRELEEEQSRLELELAVAERNRAQQEIALAAHRQVMGRRNFTAGIVEQNSLARAAGLFESEEARRQRLRLHPQLEAADAEVARQQTEFLLRRTGRRQVETLVENEHGRAEVEAGRRAQQMLDDWYGRRKTKERPSNFDTSQHLRGKHRDGYRGASAGLY